MVSKQVPRVSVVLPVYNAERFVAEAIESILGQSFSDFELILIDDGSTDSSLNIMQNYQSKDSRIQIISRENRGLIATLNEGVTIAKGEFIARMDADDISMPERFENQVAFFDANPAVSCCGAAVETFHDKSKVVQVTYFPLCHDELYPELLFTVPVGHPVVMFRRSYVERFGLTYDPEYVHCEDYELWSRWAECGKLANLPDVLLRYRMHDNQVSVTGEETLIPNHLKVTKKMLAKLDMSLTEDDRAIFLGKIKGESPRQVIDMYEKVMTANDDKHVFDPESLRKLIIRRTEKVIHKYYGINGIREYMSSSIFEWSRLYAPSFYLLVARIGKKAIKNRLFK